MKVFNEHQQRLWENMIHMIDAYKANNIPFSELVSSLHGGFQAGEFKDKELVREWYDFWGELEIHNAVNLDKGGTPAGNEVIKDIEAMQRFLIRQLKNRHIPNG